ncbi:hypothetical protein ACHAXR_006384 [Thalassiosira sp. AJA248-18]
MAGGGGGGGGMMSTMPITASVRVQGRFQRRRIEYNIRTIVAKHHCHPWSRRFTIHPQRRHAYSSITPSLLFRSYYWSGIGTSRASSSSSSTTSKTTSQISANKTNNDNHNSEEEMNRRTLYGLLKLSNFNKCEFDWRFDRIIQAGDRVNDQCSEQQPINTTLSVQKRKNNFDNKLYTSPSPIIAISTKDNDNDDITDIQQQREIMSIHDLEAYLSGRYQRMDDKWKQTNANKTMQPNDDDGDDDDDQEALQRRLERIQHRAKSDANTIFQLLLQNAPPPTEEDLASLQSISANTTTNTTTATTPHHTATNEQTLTKRQFRQSLRALATQIHYPTILPLAASMLLVGSSVGVISPIMPFIAAQLELTSTHYGIVVSSFAFSKMMGNVPSAILVERHGRKPYLVHSLWLIGLGAAGMGLSSDWVQLSCCRMTVGLGVAALTTASTLTMADVSTPLSRASTLSPLMSAFAAGMALGPAIGGILHDAWGIRDTFFTVGLIYGVAAIWNHVSVNETMRTGEWWEKDTLPWHNDVDGGGTTKKKKSTIATPSMESSIHSDNSSMTTTISQAVKDTTEQWTYLLADPRVRPVVIMNGFYMLALSGTQFTLLPLILTGGGATASAGTAAGLALTASAVGQLYMWMSAVSVLGNPAAGRFADRAGKGSAIVVGGTLTSFAMASVPIICAYGLVGDASLASNDINWPLLAGTLGVWSLGGALLATSHVAAVSDAVDDSRRSQAIALLRTAGDVGYLCGAISAGLAADLAGDVGLAMQGGSAVLMGSTAWFGLKTLSLRKLDQSRKK